MPLTFTALASGTRSARGQRPSLVSTLAFGSSSWQLMQGSQTPRLGPTCLESCWSRSGRARGCATTPCCSFRRRCPPARRVTAGRAPAAAACCATTRTHRWRGGWQRGGGSDSVCVICALFVPRLPDASCSAVCGNAAPLPARRLATQRHSVCQSKQAHTCARAASKHVTRHLVPTCACAVPRNAQSSAAVGTPARVDPSGLARGLACWMGDTPGPSEVAPGQARRGGCCCGTRASACLKPAHRLPLLQACGWARSPALRTSRPWASRTLW